MGVRNAATYLGIHGPGLIGQFGRPNGSTLPAAALLLVPPFQKFAEQRLTLFLC